MSSIKLNLAFLLAVICYIPLHGQGMEGYYQFPSIHENTIYFSAEGDLWKADHKGGVATRLTTHAEEERYPMVSPDGKLLAFSASYEGPTEVYTMPVDGGIPARWTYESDFSMVNGWTPDGKIIYDTRAYSTLPDRQLVVIDMKNKSKERVPLSQASEASYDETGKTVFFVRPAFHGNVTKRYKGGTARQIWKYTAGSEEAIQLTMDYDGGSHHPMFLSGRVYFISDRDGTMNIWSMNTDGGDLMQHTKQDEFDVRYAKGHKNNIVYQVGADIWHYDIDLKKEKKIKITLLSDFEQLQVKWDDSPADNLTAIAPDSTGEKVVVTARGRLFVKPVKGGRFVEFTKRKNVRYRDAVFSENGDKVIALSDQTGEFEFVELPADGIGAEKMLTTDGALLRYEGNPSPDGKWIAYDDLHGHMYILNKSNGKSKLISLSDEDIGQFSWSPDSKWLAYVQAAGNTMNQIHIYELSSGEQFPLTTDRANSSNPQWSPDGKFIYFLSDRNFNTIVGSPWGPRQPEPYFDAGEKIYHIALEAGNRSPFRPKDELYEEEKSEKEEVDVKIDKSGIQERIMEVPIKPGNFRNLAVNDKAIYVVESETGVGAKSHLKVLKIGNEDVKLETGIEDIRSYEMTADGKKLLVTKGKNYHMVSAGTGKISDFNEGKIDFSSWKFEITPREDWKQIFTDAWRMERDYFYDANMHGVDWKGMHDKYFPLVDRVTTRSELSDLIGRFVGELSALHTSVHGGDMRSDDENIPVANLGAMLTRDESKGGFVIEYIYKADPDYPDEKSPLDDPYLNVKVGDVITEVNGQTAIAATDIGELLRNQVGKQVRLGLASAGEKREIIVEPIGSIYRLKYRDWEYSRRLMVEEQSDQKIGYVHLQAMGANDLNQWYREFYPVFDRPGLIVDVRHNRGGNIESFILEKLMRKAWMFWKSRSGKPTWNMQYAFRGHIVILVDENTASDGEAFADGFKKLNMGTAIGTRTWGGEIWLGSQNRLSDNGLARAPMAGVYGENGEWLIEGHGFVPDIIIMNKPHETFKGKDAQLEAAIEHLEKLIKEDPREVTPAPAFPDKSFKNNKK
ncbi:S41 family peptidase [Portibacter lacus]|nr:S41 family peptidase [Portibacter lacus]